MNRHGSDGHCNMRLERDLHLIGGLRNWLAVLKPTLNNRVNPSLIFFSASASLSPQVDPPTRSSAGL
jgi:hypothetical protein